MKTITIKDIRNPTRISGFDHVNSSKGGPKSGAKLERWRASIGPKARGKSYLDWKGPTRPTPEEAAQDYCDYVNGNKIQPAPILKNAGHSAPPRSQSTPEEQRLRARLRKIEAEKNKDRRGYVYLIGEEGYDFAVKVGHSYDPPSRPNGLQTGNPRKLKVLAYFEGTLDDERALHAKYIENNILQEWFRPTPELLSEFGIAIKAAA